MGQLLSGVQAAGERYHELEAELKVARSNLRYSMRTAHNEGISMAKIAAAAGVTRQGVRYLLGRQPQKEA